MILESLHEIWFGDYIKTNLTGIVRVFILILIIDELF